MKIQELSTARSMQDLAFYISGLGADSFIYDSRHRNPYHTIMWVTGGQGAMNIDGSDYAVKASDLLLMAAGQLYQVAPGSNFQGYILSFGDPFWERTPASARNCKASLFNSARLHQLLTLDESNGPAMTKLFAHLLDEYTADNYSNKPDVMAAFLKIIIIKAANIKSLLTLHTNNHDYRLYQRFLELIGQDFTRQHSVVSYARQLGLSTRKLTEICKLYGGEGAKELINDRLIVEAKRLLQFSVQPVKEISFSLNFATPYQFSNFFKKHTRQSPTAYKKQFAEIGI
ncbi:helix-turn-helix domain-containing protein [Chitinophaga agrisoli]|uniref:Helix-turn-helix domain-containing protein n=1 Tax=Chitinophaga agrisoli TaxID=2607653 RepID=A0A5B2VPW8_9BACT|nr:AraC family transcriptional regulator [Chitinophaga agrisoli]KAA2240760.1 helix-turn-helix domain-containing protein [Chitinophaga agrisoli]